MRALPKRVLAGAVLAAGLLSGSLMPPSTAAENHRQPHRVTSAAEEPGSFNQLMLSSMERMHTDMTLPLSGNPDRDFARMMIPHHQGAVDMAKAELIYGRNKVLRRLAQGIIVEQQQEIEVMRAAIADMESGRSR
jgi:uncharacterized protein (DUF305 family)